MVEALDRMVSESLIAEVRQLKAEKAALAEDRVKFQRKIKEDTNKFNNFMVSKLAEEIGELRRDRKTHNEGLKKLEGFIVHALASEIQEFAQDKRDVVETKVRLVTNARSQLEGLKARFVKESADKMTQAVSKHLKAELSQLKEDIQVARENNFGRRIFEAYSAEFGATHLNEKAEVRKLHNMLAQKDQKIAEAIKFAKKASGVPSVTYDEALDVAIVDGRVSQDSSFRDFLAGDASTIERRSEEEDGSLLLVVVVLGKKLPGDEGCSATRMPPRLPEGRLEEEAPDVGFSSLDNGGEAGRFKLVAGFIKTVIEESLGLYPG
jgi:hypothetical protein